MAPSASLSSKRSNLSAKRVASRILREMRAAFLEKYPLINARIGRSKISLSVSILQDPLSAILRMINSKRRSGGLVVAEIVQKLWKKSISQSQISQ